MLIGCDAMRCDAMRYFDDSCFGPGANLMRKTKEETATETETKKGG